MELTFAQALNEAKQVIVQQAGRIKADNDKIRVQQDMLMSQGTTLGEQERRLQEQADELQKLTASNGELSQQLHEAITAREQAETIINRQGERVQGLQANIVEFEKKVGEQSERIAELERTRDSLLEKLPTQDDAEALAAMSALLSRKISSTTPAARPQMRLAEAA
jgi:predicted RNase H-like nuclease (RuvC/YqgF family)